MTSGECISLIRGHGHIKGTLPISWPSDAAKVGGDFDGAAPSPLGDQPRFFDQLPGTGSGPGHAYNPLYPFGFGLTYTTFEHSDLSVSTTVSANGWGSVRFTVKNTGSVDGTDIVPVYVKQPVSDKVTPPQRLVAFARVTVKAGQSRTVNLRFKASALGETAGDIDASAPPTVQSGKYLLQLNKNTTTPYDVELSAEFRVS